MHDRSDEDAILFDRVDDPVWETPQAEPSETPADWRKTFRSFENLFLGDFDLIEERFSKAKPSRFVIPSGLDHLRSSLGGVVYSHPRSRRAVAKNCSPPGSAWLRPALHS